MEHGMEKILNTRSSHRKHTLETKVRKVGFYLRVSTEEQAENPEGSIKNQEERLKLALKFKNIDGSFGEFQGVYCDAGRSGKDMNRPELKRLFKAIETGEINMVMVTELSRLSRSIKDFSQIWEFMQAHGCAFLSLRENFDTSTAAGEMMLYSIANFAQFERRQTSERVAAGFLSRAQRGLWNGGTLPLGYESDPDKRGSLRIVETEAAVVRTAFESVLSHRSVLEAAKWLNQNGYSLAGPLRGGGFRPRRMQFTFESLYRLVSNAAYAGRRIVRIKNGKIEIVPAVWPAIIEAGIFDRAQLVLEAGRKQKIGRARRYPYLLSTRIVCGECGVALIGNSAHGRNGKVPYYAHGSQIRREHAMAVKGPRCNPFRVPGAKLEERVWREILLLIERPSHRGPLFEAIRALSESSPDLKEKESKEAELIAASDKIANLARRVAELPAGVPADAFYEEMKRLSESQTMLKLQAQEIRQRGEVQKIASEAEFEKLLDRLKSRLTDLSPESKRRIIQTLVQKIVVTADGFELYYFVGVDQIKKGETFVSPSISLDKNYFALGSVKDLNG
jgi:site-specific DNA recombinase